MLALMLASVLGHGQDEAMAMAMAIDSGNSEENGKCGHREKRD